VTWRRDRHPFIIAGHNAAGGPPYSRDTAVGAIHKSESPMSVSPIRQSTPIPHRRLEGWLICALGGRYGSIKFVHAGPLFARLEKPLYLAGDDEYERFDLTGKAVGLIAVHNAYSLNSEIKTELLPGVGGRHRRYAT
jgi:hypothetical protein